MTNKSDEEFLRNLGERIRSIRHSKGWTLEETEEHGWPSWKHLQRIESGKNVTILTLRKIAETYKIPLHEILDSENL